MLLLSIIEEDCEDVDDRSILDASTRQYTEKKYYIDNYIYIESVS